MPRASGSFPYDVALSFAGEDRLLVERFATHVARAGFRVFYDLWEQPGLWGKDLYQHLDSVYRDQSRFCVVFVSAAYAANAWTSHELRSAQARSFSQMGEYLLPIRLDDTQLPGLPTTIAYVDARTSSIEEIARLFIVKLSSLVESEEDVMADLLSSDQDRRLSALSRIALHGLAEYLPLLLEMIEGDPDIRIRERTAWALDNLNDIRALPSLLQALQDSSFSVRSNAGWALVHLGECAVAPVMAVLQTSNSSDAKEMAKLVLDRL